MNEITLAIHDGKITTTSLTVAEHFGKKHYRVLRAIENLECSPEFRAANFGVTFNEVPGPNGATRQDKAFTLTRDGFTFLCMGFTGRDAAAWKEKYIAAFNAMEARLNVGAGTTAVKALPLTDPLNKNLRSRINRRAHALAMRQYESIHAYITEDIESNLACGSSEAKCEGYIDQFGGLLGQVTLVNSRDIITLAHQTTALLDAAGDALATIHRLEEQFDCELYRRTGTTPLPMGLCEEVLSALQGRNAKSKPAK